MKNPMITIIMMVLLVSCGSTAPQDKVSVPETVLTIIVGDNQQTFTTKDLQALPSTVSSFDGKEYMGVSVNLLLEEAGININEVSVIKAVATDGYSVNYEHFQ